MLDGEVFPSWIRFYVLEMEACVKKWMGETFAKYVERGDRRLVLCHRRLQTNFHHPPPILTFGEDAVVLV